ncbi:MAG: methyltransferase domain-containing protein [Patescibacteria group bacterium]
MVKLDIGCGPRPKDGFLGVDVRSYGRSDIVVADLRFEGSWAKWEDDSVDEAFSSHFVEHLTAPHRILFANELYRILKPGGFAEIITPHWASARAYGDLTHQWPPVSPFWFNYLRRSWREANAPHACDDYTCDFTVDWGTSLHPQVGLRNQEFQQFATTFYIEANQDMHSTWRKA